MAARAYWQGQIRLALVSIPVEIYSATRRAATVAFRQIHEPSGKPVHYEKVVTGIGPIDPDEIIKGYEYSKGNYVLLDEDELEAVKLESKRTLELTQFVSSDEIDPIYFDTPYYVTPADELAEEAFIVLREALRRAKKIGIGQLAMRGREYVVSLKPCGRGMVLETLRYDEELNRAESYFRSIGTAKPDPELLDLASALIERRTGKFDAGEYKNRYVDALKELIARKHKSKGRKIKAEDEPAPASSGNVIDLMAALKKSIGGETRSARASAPKAKREPAPKAKPRARKRA